MDPKLKRSNIQRVIALENAFNILDAFVIPSADPDTLEKYEEVKKYLLDMYSVGISDLDKKGYEWE